MLERAKQVGAERAVAHAVIARERHRHLAHETEAVLALDRPPLAGADRQDGRLWRIDDRRELADAVHAEIGDRARATLVFVRLQSARPPALDEVLHLGRDVEARLALRLADHRREKAALDRGRDADVGRAATPDEDR